MNLKYAMIVVASALAIAALPIQPVHAQEGGGDLLLGGASAGLGLQLLEESYDYDLSAEAKEAQLRGAEAAFTDAILQRPANPDYWFWRAVVRYRLGDFDGAWEDYVTARSLRPVPVVIPLWARLSVCRPIGRCGGCLWPLPNACVRRGASVAEFFGIDGNPARSRAPSGDPTVEEMIAQSFCTLGDQSSDRGEYETAVRYYDIATSLDPTYAPYYFKRGAARLHLADGQGDKAGRAEARRDILKGFKLLWNRQGQVAKKVFARLWPLSHDRLTDKALERGSGLQHFADRTSKGDHLTRRRPRAGDDAGDAGASNACERINPSAHSDRPGKEGLDTAGILRLYDKSFTLKGGLQLRASPDRTSTPSEGDRRTLGTALNFLEVGKSAPPELAGSWPVGSSEGAGALPSIARTQRTPSSNAASLAPAPVSAAPGAASGAQAGQMSGRP